MATSVTAAAAAGAAGASSAPPPAAVVQTEPAATPPLTYEVLAKCSTTKARVGLMKLRHSDVSTPVFMPVGTQVRVVDVHFDTFSYRIVLRAH